MLQATACCGLPCWLAAEQMNIYESILLVRIYDVGHMPDFISPNPFLNNVNSVYKYLIIILLKYILT